MYYLPSSRCRQSHVLDVSSFVSERSLSLVVSIVNKNIPCILYRFNEGKLIYSLIVAKFHKQFVNNIFEFNMTMCRCLIFLKVDNAPRPQKFFEEYVKLSKAAIFRGAIKDTKGFKIWEDSYMREHYGDLEVRLEAKGEKVFV